MHLVGLQEDSRTSSPVNESAVSLMKNCEVGWILMEAAVFSGAVELLFFAAKEAW